MRVSARSAAEPPHQPRHHRLDRPYWIVNPELPTAAFPPDVHVTVALANPGFLVLGFQVQDTAPPLPAVRVPARALLVDAEPDA